MLSHHVLVVRCHMSQRFIHPINNKTLVYSSKGKIAQHVVPVKPEIQLFIFTMQLSRCNYLFLKKEALI